MTDFIVSAEGDVKRAQTILSDAAAEAAAIEAYGSKAWAGAKAALVADEEAVDAEWLKIRGAVLIGFIAIVIGFLLGHFA